MWINDQLDTALTAQGADADAGIGRRVLSFAGLPFLSLITPFLFLPILARVAGTDAWVAIAVGQSIGAFFALAVGLGYNTVGPARVALAGSAERPALLAASIRARAVIWAPAALAAAATAALVAPDANRLDAALMAVAMSLTGLSSSWYIIGLGRAGLIALFEILPRMLATLAAVPFLLIYGQVVWYPIFLIAASLGSVMWFTLRTVGARALLTRHRGEFGGVWVSNRAAVTTEVAGGAYSSLAVTFVSLVTPSVQAARYISGDKLYRIGQYAVSSLGNSVQGWVVEDARLHFTRRARRSFLMHLALGLAGLVGFATVGSWLSAALFGPQVAIDEATAVGFGVATLWIALGTTLGRITLVGLGANRAYMASVLIGAAVGAPSILVLASQFGAAGGAWGLAIGEFAVVSAQSIFLARRWKAGAVPVA